MKVVRIVRRLAALSLGALSLLVWDWIVMWGLPPFTLEGLWIYPLAITTSLGAVLAWPRKPSQWDAPPGSAS